MKEQILSKVQDYCKNGVELTYIDYRDCFDDEQLSKYLFDEYSFWDNFENYDGEQETVLQILKDLLTEDEFSFFLDDDDTREEIDQIFYENNTSDTFKDLLRNTPKTLFRYDIPEEERENFDLPLYFDDGEEDLFLRKCMELKLNKEQCEELRSEISSDFGRLCLYFYEEPEKVYDIINSGAKKISFKKPCFFVHNDWLGTCSSGVRGKEITLDFYKDNLKVDRAEHYGLDEICGFYAPGFEENSFNIIK